APTSTWTAAPTSAEAETARGAGTTLGPPATTLVRMRRPAVLWNGMTTVLAAARAGWRGQRRAWLSLAIVAAIGSGAVMTAALGARRTDTAYTRFAISQLCADIVIETI